jgi:hypothetical protein
MSGIEVLGLVLGIVPLFITAFEKYEHGYRILTEWIEFRREFCDFSSRFRLQKIRLSQLAETTLRSVTESEDAVQAMLKNPKCEKWKDPAITERLKYKLSGEGEYETYNHGIANVYDRLKEIEDCLHIHDQLVSSFCSIPGLVAELGYLLDSEITLFREGSSPGIRGTRLKNHVS